MEAAELERAVCMGDHIAHLIRPGEARALCGTGPLIPLSAMGDWQETWRRQACGYELCQGCAIVAGEAAASAVA